MVDMTDIITDALRQRLPDGQFDLNDGLPWGALDEAIIDMHIADVRPHEDDVLLAVATVVAETVNDLGRRRVMSTLYASHIVNGLNLLDRFRTRQSQR